MYYCDRVQNVFAYAFTIIAFPGTVVIYAYHGFTHTHASNHSQKYACSSSSALHTHLERKKERTCVRDGGNLNDNYNEKLDRERDMTQPQDWSYSCSGPKSKLIHSDEINFYSLGVGLNSNQILARTCLRRKVQNTWRNPQANPVPSGNMSV